MVRYRLVVVFLLSLFLTGCGYNTLQAEDEAMSAAWSEVLNQYQRRADLVPNLVNTVKGYAAHEERVFTQVTDARAQVGRLQWDAATAADEKKINEFIAAQKTMSSALSRLLVVSENYPQLKADVNFRDLQAQLEGTENRITLARKRYIDAVRHYNTDVRSFPTNVTAMIFGLKPRPNFTVENEPALRVAPPVDFSSGVKQKE